jgi:hypothetical protein
MKKTIEVNGITYTYNIESLIEDAKGLEWEVPQELYGEDDELLDEEIHGIDTNDYEIYSQEEFDKTKDYFIKEIEKLTDEKTLIKELNRLHITKKGDLAKNRRHVIVNSGIMFNYSGEWGSHNYEEYVIEVYPNGEKCATLGLSEINHQDPF